MMDPAAEPRASAEAEDRVDRRAEIPVNRELLRSEAFLVLPEKEFDRREIDAGKIPLEDIPVHEDRHPLVVLGIVLVDDSRFFEELLLRGENLAVILARREFFDDRVEVTLDRGREGGTRGSAHRPSG